jgi:hypothetical protein
VKFVDGLINPRVYRKALPKRRRQRRLSWRWISALVVVAVIGTYVLGPTVTLFADQVELFKSLTNGRYLVLFQNDGEARASGGFIGSFAVIEAKDNTVKPLYFETNIYKLDDPYNATTKIDAPKPLMAAIKDRGWGLRDSNFAADFRQSAPTVEWFFSEETKQATGAKKAELDKALSGNYALDGVIATNMSAFLDLLDAIGPITIPQENITVSRTNFFPVVQQVVESDYFLDPTKKQTNEPKTVLQNLFPLAMNKAQSLPKTTQYKLVTKLLREKKVVIYSNDTGTEDVLVNRGWAGALQMAADHLPKGPSDFLAIVRSAHGGNKSSLDIDPKYQINIEPKGDQLNYKLEITQEHTGTGTWPSGVNHEYLRALVPTEATLVKATQNGDDVTAKIDIGKESGKAAFGFWLHTDPKSSQSMTLEYTIPSNAVKSNKYSLSLIRQPGGNSPDVTVTYKGRQLYLARLTEDRTVAE